MFPFMILQFALLVSLHMSSIALLTIYIEILVHHNPHQDPCYDPHYNPNFRDFAPDIVLVSAGFDAGVGHEHPIGGYKVIFFFTTVSQIQQDCRLGEPCMLGIPHKAIAWLGQRKVPTKPSSSEMSSLP